MVSALERKLLRDLGTLRGQVFTIALVVACGIASYVSMYGAWRSLEGSMQSYYAQQRFGDVFVHLERAPEGLKERIADIAGVAQVSTRVYETVRVPLEGLSQPATGQIVSLPPHGEPVLNSYFIRQGRRPEPGRSDEAMLLESFAIAHQIELGQRIPVVLHGKLRRLRIVGIALSPEFVYPMAGGVSFSDVRNFAALWMNRDAVAAAFQMEGAFNDVTLRLQPGASVPAVTTQLDRLLDRYGGLGAIDRSKQPSNFVLQGELTQLRGMAVVLPAIFLCVGAFLLNVVLARLVELQRQQIATLKAIGYSNLEVGLHYLKLVTLIVVIGGLIGAALGAWLGSATVELYKEYFRFPVLRYRLDLNTVLTGFTVSLAAALAGGLGAARRVMRMAPAEAMRPAPPVSYRKTLSERAGLFRVLGMSARMVVRELERRPLRTVVSALAIAMAVGIMVVGRYFNDAIEHLMDVGIQSAQREDFNVVFSRPVPRRTLNELTHLPGVTYAEGLRMAPVRFRAGHRWRDSSLVGYPEHAELRRVLHQDGQEVTPPPEGVVLTKKLAEVLRLQVGDSVRVEIREGRRGKHDLVVTGLVDEMFGLFGHMRLGSLNRLLGESPSVSMALCSADMALFPDIRRRLRQMPDVIGVTRHDTLIQLFREQSANQLLVTTLILTSFAAIIAIGVVYNNARVALSMRSRDLASLRVLGFTRGEISAVLLGELGVQVALAIVPGLYFGRLLCVAMGSGMDAEQYRLPIIISAQTYAFAIAVALISALISALLVRRKLDHLDLVGVLKTRE